MKFKLINSRSQIRKRLLFPIMKIFIFLLCTSAFCLTSEPILSQEKIKIGEDQLISVDQVFKIIQRQTKYAFIYPKNLFVNTPKIELKKGEITLGELLKLSVTQNNFSFELTKDNIIIKDNVVIEGVVKTKIIYLCRE